MANKQGWRDFRVITNRIDALKSEIKQILNGIARLQQDKIAVLDDAARKAEVKELVDRHPDYSIAGLTSDYTKLVALKAWIEANI